MEEPPTPEEMSASQDRTELIQYVKPLPVPFPRGSASSNNAAKLTKAVALYHKVRKRWDPTHLDPEFTAALAITIDVCLSLTEELPGMPESPRDTRFKKPTLDEVIAYGKTRRITVNDSEWFFDKMTGCGWKNGGKPVIDWQATIRAWYRAGYLPSQKNTQQISRGQLANPPKTPLSEQNLFSAVNKAKKALE
jgi:hypothetical protein